MAAFPSKVAFAAFLRYAPRGSSPISKASRDITYAVKQDGTIPFPPRGATAYVNAIDYAAKRLAEELPKYPFLADYFGPSVTLVPAPKSSPLVTGALWVPLRICQSIQRRQLAASVLPCVERIRPVTKSATAAPGQRPEPADHYDSLQVKKQLKLVPPRSITIVDDVITRGSTLVALSKRLEEAFPGVPVRCFALVRTMSPGEVDSILEPVKGTITLGFHSLSRQP